MKRIIVLPLTILVLIIANMQLSFAQSPSLDNSFEYSLELVPVDIPNLTGLHSYAFAQHNGKWLIIGGRKDGMHARQPFNTFPEAQNNSDIYVVDVNSKHFWTASVNSLPIGLKEQLQSTNMNFYQDNETLYIIGGYAFSPTNNDHITFPYLSSIQVPALIEAIVQGNSINQYFKQITDDIFAVTGGQLGKIEEKFYMVGGQKFDGRYNPMGNPTFIQKYTNQIRMFTIDNSGTELSYANYSTMSDDLHLRRRDYNLVPQIFPDGEEGYTISSGVFQLDVDLPFLYPVDITANAYIPNTSFNQYLSHYHSAKVALYDNIDNQMHSIFFGGMSQYYYQNDELKQDEQVPFVKTISRITRYADGSMQEFQLGTEMPALKGSGAEFFINKDLPHFTSEIIKLNEVHKDTILLGHIFGGILSPSLNTFSNNQTNTTSADKSIYEVKLIRNATSIEYKIDGNNPYTIQIFPNPVKNKLTINYELKNYVAVNYFISNSKGQILDKGKINNQQDGNNSISIILDDAIPAQTLFVTFVFDNIYFVTEKILKE